MFKGLAVVTAVFATAAAAQSNSYVSNNPAPIKGDLDKIVCQKEEQIGSRLGAKKVCLTVKEWQDRVQHNREETERAQNNTWVRDAT